MLFFHELFKKIFLIWQSKGAEKQAIAEGIKQNGEEDSDKVIKAVLANRQAQVSDKVIKAVLANRQAQVSGQFFFIRIWIKFFEGERGVNFSSKETINIFWF